MAFFLAGEENAVIYEDNGIAFDVAPRDPSWMPYQGVLPPRLKMWLGRQIDQARKTEDSDNFNDGRKLAALEGLAAGRERFWFGVAKEQPATE